MAIDGSVRARLFGRPGEVDRVTYTTPWGPKVSIHPQILARFRAACELAHRTITWRPQRIDSYNGRPIRGEDGLEADGKNLDLDEWSLHAFALACDFFATPPNVPPPGGVWTPDNGVPAEFAACFTRYGFRWGATFKRKDVPHIEWADGIPAPLAAAADIAPTEEDDMPTIDEIANAAELGALRALDKRNVAVNLEATLTLAREIAGHDDVDEQAIAAAVLTGLDPGSIATAITKAGVADAVKQALHEGTG